jgi:type III secretion protein K
MSTIALAAASDAPGSGAQSLLRLVMQHNLHPEASLHPSWLPPSWPARHRARLGALAPTARDTLGDALRHRGVLPIEPDYRFDSRRKRLLLLDPPALRRLAIYTSLCLHAPLLRPRRDVVSAQLRRQARRIDADAVEFVLERAPQLTELHMAAQPLRDRPASAGRVLIERGAAAGAAQVAAARSQVGAAAAGVAPTLST